LWDARKYDQLIAELLATRVESSPRVTAALSGSTAAAALGLIRLDELNQSHTPIAQNMLRCIIASQGSDGGWNDPLLCALCVRSLLTSRGHGLAIERGLASLANLQRDDGIWPAEPIRRMPGDALVTAFILLQLGSNEQFRSAVRFDAAITWFDRHVDQIDGEIAKLWHHARLRAGVSRFGVPREREAQLWS
jgi:hypothetical protein